MLIAKVGLAGSGLTEHCLRHYLHLLETPHPPDRILVIVRNQRQVQEMTRRILDVKSSLIGPLHIYTFIAFVKQTLSNSWARILESEPSLPASLEPAVLLKDLTQYVLLKTCELCPQHAPIFESSRLRPYQVWDQISSAAYIAGSSGIAPEDISPRLIEAWPDLDDETRIRQLGSLSCCVKRLRHQSLALGSLEFGTLLDLFQRGILSLPEFWGSFDHLIVDQVEDSSAIALDFYKRACQRLQSVFVAYTVGGGVAQTSVPNLVGQFVIEDLPYTLLTTPYKSSHAWTALGLHIASTLDPSFNHPFEVTPPDEWPPVHQLDGDTQLDCIELMLTDIEVHLAQGVDPSQIAIIAPKLESALILTLQNHLQDRLIVFRSYPALIKYPLIRALLTLAELAHPEWTLFPLSFELQTLFTFLLKLDPIRADLLVQDVRDPLNQSLRMSTAVRTPERIGFTNLQAYQRLLNWILEYQTGSRLSIHHFLQKVLVELVPAALLRREDQQLLQTLTETARRFCHDLPTWPQRDFLTMMREGLTLSRGGEDPLNPPGLVVATPVDYINQGLCADHHYWFDVTNSAWSRSRWRALYNAHVLTPEWNQEPFGEEQDQHYQAQTLATTVLNLCCRIHQSLTLVSASFNSRGEVNTGDLNAKVMRAYRSRLGSYR